MKQSSARQSAAAKARVRRLRAQYRRRMVVACIVFFILGVVAGAYAYRWHVGHRHDAVQQPAPTPVPGWATGEGQGDDAVPEDEDAAAGEDDALPEADGPEKDVFPELGQGQPDEDDELIFPETEPEAEPEGEGADDAEETPVPERGTPEPTPVPDMSSDSVEEFDPAEGEVPDEYLTVPDENGEVEAAPADGTEVPEATEAPAEPEVSAEPEAPVGPQVVAIVPFGESFTYTTQIKQDGSARVEVSDEPYETISFTQTMKTFMRPSDFAEKYSTKYKLQGDEAGAGFELTLNDYTGEATIVPQNVIDISLRSESGDNVERGYQLMDAEIAGNYGIALTPDTPKMLYKRYQYSTVGEEMAYLVVTTYNDGVVQMILFQLESDEPEPTPEVVYNILQKGVTSDEVADLQARLIDLGYLSGAADGNFGQMTEDAIKAAQKAFGLEQTGVADNAFQQKLYEGAAPVSASETAYPTLRNGSTGENVVKLQLRLRELGYYGGKADGGFGAITESAVKKAQEAFGLEQTGVADDALQQKLYADEEAADEETADGEPEAGTGADAEVPAEQEAEAPAQPENAPESVG